MIDKLLRDLMMALRRLDSLDWRDRGFYMGSWAEGGRPETPELGCGMAACAYGVGTTLPSWKAAGLGLIRSPNGKDLIPCDNAKDLLELSEREWDFIFYPCTYDGNADDISPGAVADRINHLLNGGTYDSYDVDDPGDIDISPIY